MNKEKANDAQSFLPLHLLPLPSCLQSETVSITGSTVGLRKKGEGAEREKEKVAAGLPPGFVPVDT